MMSDTNEGDEEEQQEHDDESCTSKQTSTTAKSPRQGEEEEEITNEDNEEEQGSDANLVVVGRRRRSCCHTFTRMLAFLVFGFGWLFGWATGVWIFLTIPNSGVMSCFVGIAISVSLTAGSYAFLAREQPALMRSFWRDMLLSLTCVAYMGCVIIPVFFFPVLLVLAFTYLAFYLSDATSGWATLALLCLQVYASKFAYQFGLERMNEPRDLAARRSIDLSLSVVWLGSTGGFLGSIGLIYWAVLGFSPLPLWVAYMVPLAILTALFWGTSKVSACIKQRQSTAPPVAYELAANDASMKHNATVDASGKTTCDFDDDRTEAECTTSSDIV